MDKTCDYGCKLHNTDWKDEGKNYKSCVGLCGNNSYRDDKKFKEFITYYDNLNKNKTSAYIVNNYSADCKQDTEVSGNYSVNSFKYSVPCGHIVDKTNLTNNNSFPYMTLQGNCLPMKKCNIMTDHVCSVNNDCDEMEKDTCIVDTESQKENNKNIASLQTLSINSTNIQSVINSKLSKIGLQALDKIWGSTKKFTNNGVSSKNVHYLQNETVKDWKGQVLKNQTVLALDVHGDKYEGNVKGFQYGTNKSKKLSCPPVTKSTTGKRVGACIATTKNYGPGVYKVKAMIPRTTDKSTDGRGYVFAMWTFHYEEMYRFNTTKQKPKSTSLSSTDTSTDKVWCFSDQYVANPNKQTDKDKDNHPMAFAQSTCDTWLSADVPVDKKCCVNYLSKDSKLTRKTAKCTQDDTKTGKLSGTCQNCGKDPTTPIPNSPGYCTKPTDSGKKDFYWDCFNPWNHEIDIEIPANSPQLAKTYNDWKQNLGWNTMNANTWIGDNGDYDPNHGTNFYQQSQINKTNGSFISENGEYHEYKIDWKVYDDDSTKYNKVDFYFDEDLVYSTTKFVPTRAGKLVVGGWHGWWGTGFRSPNFDTARIKIANIDIKPYQPKDGYKIISFPQTFDQTTTFDTLKCGFSNIDQLSKAPTLPIELVFPWKIILIVSSCILLFIFILFLIVKKHIFSKIFKKKSKSKKK